MALVDNLRIFPTFPENPSELIVNISNALELALTLHVRTSFVPAGFGLTFLSSISLPTPFLTQLSTYLESTVSPVISSALSTQSSGLPPPAAWVSVQPALLSLISAVPPFMAGISGALFWSAIILTISLAILPPIPDVSGDSSESEAGSPDDVFLRIDD